MAAKNYFKILGIILFLYILSRINLSDMFLALKNIDLKYFFIAVAIMFFSPVFGILKWQEFIKAQNYTVGFKTLCHFYFKGIFWGTVTPGKLGEFFKMKYLSTATPISKGRAFFTVLADRLVDLIILAIVGLIGAIYFVFTGKIATFFIFLSVSFLLFLFLIYFLSKKGYLARFFKFFIVVLEKFAFKDKIEFFTEDFFKGIKALNSLNSAKIIIYGLFYYISSVMICFFLSLSLGFNIGFLNLFLIVAINLLILMIPVTILGIGTREAGFIFFLGIFAVKAPIAVAFSELNLLVSLFLAIPGLILFLKDKK